MCRCWAASLFILLIATPAVFSQPPTPQKPVPKDRTDRRGDPLPPGAVERLGTLQLWHAFQTFCVALSPDGKTMATGGDDGKIRVWDRATGKETRAFDLDKFLVSCVTFSPDGKTLAFGRGAPHLCDFGLLDLESGKVIHRMFSGKWPVHSLIFTPDGKRLISGNYDGVSIWNTATGKLDERNDLLHADEKSWRFIAVALTADGKTLAIATPTEGVVLWDLAAKKELRRWEAKGIDAVAFSPDGKTLVGIGPGHSLWSCDTATGKDLVEFKGHTDWVRAVTFSPDGKLLASAGEDGTIRFWEPTTGKELHRFGEQYGRFRSLTFSGDGKTLVSAGSKIALWDVASQKDQLPTPGHKDGVFSLAVSPDGKTLASTSFDQTLRIWNLTTGEELRRVAVRERWSGQSVFSPDSKTVVWTDDKTLCVADAATGKNLRQFETKAKVWCVTFSPDGKLLATGSDDHVVELRDAANGKVVRTIETGKNTATELVFSPDGSTLATGFGGSSEKSESVLWEATTGKELVRLKGHTKSLRVVTFAPDGRQVLTGSSDNTIRLWDARTGKEIRQLQGVKDTVFSVAFSPDGSTIAGAVQDGSVRLWETATGKERGRFEGHRSWAMSVVFSPDGRRVISGSSDTTCLVWDVTGKLQEK